MRPRTFAALALALLTLVVCVPGASASDPVPNMGLTNLAGTYFNVYYFRAADATCAKRAITQERAGDVLRMAERSYGFYNSWGYTPWSGAPVHISVDEFDKAPPACITDGVIDPSIPKDPTDGSLSPWNALINPFAPGGTDEIHLDEERGLNYHTIAREVFYLFGRVMNPSAWDPAPPPPSMSNQWLAAASAEWAAFRTNGFADVTASDLAGNPGRSLDCAGTECGATSAEADRNGYSGWLLVEYLAERFGNNAVKEMWTQPAGPAVTQLANVLTAHGTTLSSFFNDYVAARISGTFSVSALAGNPPPSFDPPVSVPQVSSPIAGTSLSLNHLAAAYVKLAHAGDPAAPCYQATLALSVTLPSGVVATPYYYANTSGASAQSFAVSGSTASLTVPWNTCTGSPPAYVAIANTTTSLDGREFVLNGSVSVDKTKPAAPSAPPPPAAIGAPIVAVPNNDPPPTLSLHAPEVLKVAAKTRVLRFVAYSGGDGTLQAVLGTRALGTRNLRAGNNDVRFVLPSDLFKGLRTKKLDNLLSLTSISSSGMRGMTVTRRVVVQRPAKPKRKR
jgi:hypothetical protein